MAIQVIERSDPFGRIGKSFGEGLSEQIPKEVDRMRLSKGLQELEQQGGGLTPQQYFSRALQIPGLADRPQVVQSLSDLARQQNLRRIYGQGGGNLQDIQASPEAPKLDDIKFAGIDQRGSRTRAQRDREMGRDAVPSNFPDAEAEATALPGLDVRNETGRQFEPVKPWSTQRREDELGRELNRNPSLSLSEAQQLVSEKEARERSMPQAEREVQEWKKTTQKDLDDEFDTQLSTILQKEGKDIYSDLTGETLLNLKKQAANDLQTNPELNAKKAAEKWIKKGKQLAEAKGELKVQANRGFFDKISPYKKEETLKKLMAAEKIFAETGNRNEFFNILRTKNAPAQVDEKGNVIVPARFGFDASAGRAATIAYPRSEPIKKLLSRNKNWDNVEIRKLPQKNMQFAKEVSENLRSEDSLLAIARQAKEKNSFFDESLFFDYFRENQDNLPLTPHMKQELVIGVSDLTPNWGDVALFPAFTKSVADD